PGPARRGAGRAGKQPRRRSALSDGSSTPRGSRRPQTARGPAAKGEDQASSTLGPRPLAPARSDGPSAAVVAVLDLDAGTRLAREQPEGQGEHLAGHDGRIVLRAGRTDQ